MGRLTEMAVVEEVEILGRTLASVDREDSCSGAGVAESRKLRRLGRPYWIEEQERRPWKSARSILQSSCRNGGFGG